MTKEEKLAVLEAVRDYLLTFVRTVGVSSLAQHEIFRAANAIAWAIQLVKEDL